MFVGIMIHEQSNIKFKRQTNMKHTLHCPSIITHNHYWGTPQKASQNEARPATKY